MWRFVLASVLTILTLAGCAKVSGPIDANYNDQDLVLFAAIQPSATGRKLHLMINDEVVIKDHSYIAGGLTQTFRGIWGQRNVLALMKRASIAPSSPVTVDVYIDSNLIKRLRI